MLEIEDVDRELLEESAIFCMLKGADRQARALRVSIKKIDEWLDLRLILMEAKESDGVLNRLPNPGPPEFRSVPQE
jgi:hypothetical protein